MLSRPKLEVWQLVCAITAAEQGSIRRAAEELGTRPARVRRNLLRIEHVTGLLLFHRSRSGVRATREGERFLKEASRILHGVTILSRRKTQGQALGASDLFAGLQAPVITGRVTRALALCHERRPDLGIRLESRNRRRLLRSLDLGHIDVAILAGHLHAEGFGADGFETRHLWTERLAVALPENHQLADRSALAWADVRQEVFIAGNDGRGRAFRQILQRSLAGLTDTPHIVSQKVPQTEVLGFVRAGLGVCLTTDAWREMRIPGVRLVELTGGDADTHLDYVAVWRQGERNDARDLFLDALSTFAVTAPEP